MVKKYEVYLEGVSNGNDKSQPRVLTYLFLDTLQPYFFPSVGLVYGESRTNMDDYLKQTKPTRLIF